ncbi:hypothetical protein GCM10023085_14670 [Actinomadura viridis]|uniref:Uncharacterized protein n=1 Tax=Actinomadura viridis TaxID=58110 RepID=A0A931DTX3_9ACTN|nr:hypothetical protein [Actinomadura viridis]MBG6093837.1 hypothetical protein [Actinomadura viridis]
MSDDETIAYYDEILHARQLNEAMCWTVVESVDGPITLETVAERLGGSSSGIEELPWDAAYQDDDQHVAHLVKVGPAVGVIEINGYQGSHMLEYLSEGGRAHSAFWNINALSSLGCAALGHLLDVRGTAPHGPHRHGRRRSGRGTRPPLRSESR